MLAETFSTEEPSNTFGVTVTCCSGGIPGAVLARAAIAVGPFFCQKVRVPQAPLGLWVRSGGRGGCRRSGDILDASPGFPFFDFHLLMVTRLLLLALKSF